MKARLPKGMGGGPQNMQSMLRQAQKMQEEMQDRAPCQVIPEFDQSTSGGLE